MPTAEPPVRPRHKSFVFENAELSAGRIALHYVLAGGPDRDIHLSEVIELPSSLPQPVAGDPIVRELLAGIHRVLGVSYFKTAVPQEIIAEPTSAADAAFWNTLYTEGMGEFYFRNALPPPAATMFHHTDQPNVVFAPAKQPERALVLVGGGKDSIVAREIVRHAHVPCDGFALGGAPWITRSARAMGIELLTARRTLDAQLSELNARGAYNGHVPISACIAFIATLVAYLGGYSHVIVANERSADEGNTIWSGLRVNHQWSKSLDFERAFQGWCARRLPDGPVYFSLLRTLSEVRIAQELVQHAEYLPHFASCNANFRLRQDAEPARWCGKCPKCVFVQLIFAPFLDDQTLEQTFGRRFIEDEENRRWLEELTGISGIKPFECVGTPSESRSALGMLHKQGRLKGSLLHWYEQHWAGQSDALVREWQELLVPHGESCIPEAWEKRLHAYLGRSRP